MNKLSVLMSAACASAALGAAEIQEVIVRQQWPWSTDVKVEYRINGITAPVDVKAKFFDGATELTVANPTEAISGERYGVSQSVGTFTVDPIKAFGTAKPAMGDFRVELTLEESAPNINEVLYKIYDLDDGSCTDVTRKEILDGKYGAYETVYSNLGEGFSTGLPASDVLIWTGVTNNPAYATTKLVLRKIPGKGSQPWLMGSPETEGGRITAADTFGTDNMELQHQVTMKKDYFIGVFEITQAQYAKVIDGHTSSDFAISTDWPSYFSEATTRATRPVEQVGYNMIRGLMAREGGKWPSNHSVDNGTFLSLLRAKLAGSPCLDLPTEAQWEFACRAGTTTSLYSGKDLINADWEGDANLTVLGCSKRSGGYIGGDQTPTVDTPAGVGGTAKVGSYLPNAYGLYDMLGNVSEWCLDFFEEYTADAVEEPAGPERRNENWKRVVRGGNWTNKCRYCRSASRGDFPSQGPNPTYGQVKSYYGFRLCLTEE